VETVKAIGAVTERIGPIGFFEVHVEDIEANATVGSGGFG
jgi:hypothetical protein